MTETRHFDYIVIGCGGIGSGATYWLSRKHGKNVLGLEQFKLGHDNGGSQDYSRIIRHMYNTADYINLTHAMFDAWKEVERESGIQLVYQTGGLMMANKEAEKFFEAYASAMTSNNIPFERLSAEEIRARFPQITAPPGTTGLYEPTAGLVDAAMSNACHIQLAQKHGATVIDSCPVKHLQRDKDGKITVYTPKGVFTCRKVVVAAGAWINHVLSRIGIQVPLTVTQEQVTYIATPNIKDFTKDKFPIFLYESAEYGYYGLPIHGNTGVKVAIDLGGPVGVDPNNRSYTPDKQREQASIDLCKRFFPKAVGPILYTKTCLYALTPDRDFIIDTLDSEGWSDIVVICGAGHAFKFASVLGKIASELATDGNTDMEIEAFKFNRPAIKDPTFDPIYRLGRWNRYYFHTKL